MCEDRQAGLDGQPLRDCGFGVPIRRQFAVQRAFTDVLAVREFLAIAARLV